MVDFIDAEIHSLAIHMVGNKIQEEPLQLSEALPDLDEDILELLKKFFTKGFKNAQLQKLSHHIDVEKNPILQQVKSIFDNPDNLLSASQDLARELYETSEHPNIKAGEFYTVYFEHCYFKDEVTTAIGLFKSENKEIFLKVFPENESYGVTQDQGIRINRLDKGCIIVNTHAEDGYRVLVTDNTNPNQEAQFWKDKFLHLKPVADVYYHTANYMQMCRDFAMESFPAAPKSDKLALMNESAEYFKEEPAFDKVSFQEKVLKEPEIIEAFETYKDDYVQRKEIEIVDEFDVSAPAVKNMKKVFKSVIKLDKNFHVYVHGSRDRIVKGYDEESGMHYYQLYFQEES
ncbi:MAG: nucleoid-associated protein [Cyclobacteriaceae bacterium]